MLDKQAFYKKLFALEQAGKRVGKLLGNNQASEVVPSMRYADLSEPITKRLASAARDVDPKEWLKSKSARDRFEIYKNIVGRPPKNAESYLDSDYYNGYRDYLKRVLDKKPEYKSWANRIRRLQYWQDHKALSHLWEESALGTIYRNIIRKHYEPVWAKKEEIGRMQAIPTLTEYRVENPYTSTHHMANVWTSRAASRLAKTHPNGLVPSVTAGPTFKSHYNEHHRVNHPGGVRNKEDISAYQNGKRSVDSSPDYEATFDEQPEILNEYVNRDPVAISELGITDDQIAEAIARGRTPKTLQSLDNSIIYKGKKRGNHISDKQIDARINEISTNVISDYMTEAAKRRLKRDGAIAASINDTLWYTPLSHMSGGYAFSDFDAPLIKLNSKQRAKLQELFEANKQSFLDTVHSAEENMRQALKDAIAENPKLERAMRQYAQGRSKRIATERIERKLNEARYVYAPSLPRTMRSLRDVRYLLGEY